MTGTETEKDPQHDKDELAKALPRLTSEQLAHVSPHFVHETYQPGQMIIKQGEPADCFYILTSGHAEIWHEDLSGELHLVAECDPGQYFGETGLLQHRPRSATVRVSADGDAEVLALDRQYFEAMNDESRATEAQIAREMIQRLINLSDYQG